MTSQVNHPLVVDGTKVFLLGNGYAPVFTVRDSDGHGSCSPAPVPFLPRDGNVTSIGVRQGHRHARRSSSASTASSCPPRRSTRARPALDLPGARAAARAAQRLHRRPRRRQRDAAVGLPPGHERADPGAAKDGRKLVVGLAPGTSVTLPTGGARSRSTGCAAGRRCRSPTTRAAAPALGVGAARAGRPDAVAVRPAPAGLGAGRRRRRRAYARRGRRAWRGPRRRAARA